MKFCSVEEKLRIDVNLDQASLDHCFKKNSGKDASLWTVEYSMKMIQEFDDDANEEKFNECKEISKKWQTQKGLMRKKSKHIKL